MGLHRLAGENTHRSFALVWYQQPNGWYVFSDLSGAPEKRQLREPLAPANHPSIGRFAFEWIHNFEIADSLICLQILG